MAGSCNRRAFHCSVDSSSFLEDGRRGLPVRMAERRRIISVSATGSGWYRLFSCVFESPFNWVLDDGEGERSRLVRAVKMRCDLVVRVRAVLSACGRESR